MLLHLVDLVSHNEPNVYEGTYKYVCNLLSVTFFAYCAQTKLIVTFWAHDEHTELQLHSLLKMRLDY